MSTITIAEASGQLPQLVEQTANGDNAIFLIANGQPQAVLLNVDLFWHLIGLDEYTKRPPMPLDVLQKGFGAALSEVGYDSEEKIIELVRQVKREIADERESKRLQVKMENSRL